MLRLLALLLLVAPVPALAQERAGQSDVLAIDILLQPDAATVARAQALNARLRAQEPAGYPLDAAHAPHVTLVQRYVRRADLPRIAAAIAAVSKRDQAMAPIRASRLTAVSFAGSGLLMLDFERSAALMKLQRDVVAAVQPYSVPSGGAAAFVPDPQGPIVQGTIDWVTNFVPNASGDKFGPHITIGRASPDFLQRLAAEPFTPFAMKPSAIAIFQLGNYGTAAKRLWASNGRPH
jgi:2'-5' RNA ligase